MSVSSGTVSQGDPLTLTAAVTGSSGSPGGSVQFFADGSSAGTASLDASGHASLTTSRLAVGSHQVYAS